MYNNLDSISNDNSYDISAKNSKKKISISKTQIINERGYKELMQKKNKNSLISSHNNFINCSSNNNILYTNENDTENIMQNSKINSSVNISQNILQKFDNKNLYDISNISKESSDELSEMSFGVNINKNASEIKELGKNLQKRTNNGNNYIYNIHSKRIKNKNIFLSSCSVDNKLAHIKFLKNSNLDSIYKKVDKKNSKDYITPIKAKVHHDSSKSNNKSNGKNYSNENIKIIKNIVVNPKIRNKKSNIDD